MNKEIKIENDISFLSSYIVNNNFIKNIKLNYKNNNSFIEIKFNDIELEPSYSSPSSSWGKEVGQYNPNSYELNLLNQIENIDTFNKKVHYYLFRINYLSHTSKMIFYYELQRISKLQMQKELSLSKRKLQFYRSKAYFELGLTIQEEELFNEKN